MGEPVAPETNCDPAGRPETWTRTRSEGPVHDPHRKKSAISRSDPAAASKPMQLSMRRHFTGPATRLLEAVLLIRSPWEPCPAPRHRDTDSWAGSLGREGAD